MSTTMNCHFEPVFCHVSDDRRGGFIPAPNRDFGAFEALFGRKQTKQDKEPASCPRRFTGLLPAVRAVWGTRSRGQNGEEKHFWGHGLVQGAETRRFQRGQDPGKE